MIPNAVCDEHDKNLGTQTALTSPKLFQADAIIKLSKALSPKLLKFYVYGAIEGDRLVFYFSHSAMTMEFERDKRDILEKMRLIYVQEELKAFVRFKHIGAKIKPKSIPKQESKPEALERATGDFSINCKDKALEKIFKKIQHNIKANHERQ